MQAEEFYKEHRNKTPVALDPLNKTDEEIALWFLQGNTTPWLELDIKFELDKWIAESSLATEFYVNHRDIETGEGTHVDWKSCVLHGIDTDKTNVWEVYGYKTEPEYHWTELGNKTHAIKKFWTETFPSQDYARIRFMKLGSNGSISPHNDGKGSVDLEKIFEYPLPINIAIVHPDDCYMTIKDQGVVPFKAGKMFIVNILEDHSVINFSNQDRIHLIAHCYVGNRYKEFCELIARSYKKQYKNMNL
jgi:hypothetical protein